MVVRGSHLQVEYKLQKNANLAISKTTSIEIDFVQFVNY